MVVGILALLASVAASYVVASTRPVLPIESRAADRGVLVTLGLIGMTLFPADHLRSADAVRVVLRRLVAIVTALSLFAVVQFVTGQRFVDRLVIPGLSSGAGGDLEGRGPFSRPVATLIHPIELGAVLAMALPLALHFALYPEPGWSRWRRWLPVGAIGAATALALTRSAIISAVIAVAIVLATWPRQLRRRAYLAIGLGGVFAFVAVPGLLGTLRGMFLQVGDDPSATSRVDGYSLVREFVAEDPLVGRGFRTFLPMYRILDNQYLLTLIEGGVVGLVVLLGLFAAAAWCAVRVRRATADPEIRSTAHALFAAIVACVVSYAVFDAFSFLAAAGVLFLLMGVTAALDRTVRRAPIAPAAGHGVVGNSRTGGEGRVP